MLAGWALGLFPIRSIWSGGPVYATPSAANLSSPRLERLQAAAIHLPLFRVPVKVENSRCNALRCAAANAVIGLDPIPFGATPDVD